MSKLADKVSGIFVPVVFLISFITFLFYFIGTSFFSQRSKIDLRLNFCEVFRKTRLPCPNPENRSPGAVQKSSQPQTKVNCSGTLL